MAQGPDHVGDDDTGRTEEGEEHRDHAPEVVNAYPSTGVTAVLTGLFVIFVLGIVVLAQNTESVPFSFLWIDVEPPLFVLLLFTMAVSMASTLLGAGIWRRRRRQTRAEHEELERLRRERGRSRG